MENQSCIFCKVINKQLPSTVIAENDHVLVIKDIAPKAPVHYLIIPKKHVADVQSLTQDDAQMAGAMLLMATQLSKQLPGSQSCKLVMNNGAEAGQIVFHLHCHFLSGKRTGEV